VKALLLSAPRTLEIADVPAPHMDDGDVLVRVEACGICGSDVHGYDGSSGRRIPPLVMGHEAAGVIERVGRGVSGLNPGDRVTLDSTVSCGMCHACRRGDVNLCDRRMVLGVSCGEYRRDGAFAEYVSVPSRIVYSLPDAVPFEHAALVEPLAVALHAIGRRPPQPGESVLVIGCGVIGLLVIQALRVRGCRSVAALELDDSRLALARRVGAAVEPSGPVDMAFDAVGRPETVTAAIRAVRKGGIVVLVGNITPTVDLPLQEVVTREISLFGSCASRGEYPEAIELMARGAVDVGPLISATAPLEEGPAWFDRLYRREPGLVKVILRPPDGGP
jgi:L-iditol 2-dehydrogenase